MEKENIGMKKTDKELEKEEMTEDAAEETAEQEKEPEEAKVDMNACRHGVGALGGGV